MTSFSTFNANPQYAKKHHKWWIVDATGLELGRLAARLALVLRGKHKPFFTPHIDCGDSVVIINAEKVKITGNKLKQNKFFWHTGYAGGIKERTWGKTLSGSHPERLLMLAIKRMMPKESPLARKQLGNLRVYCGANHPHHGQNPEPLSITI